MRKKVSLLIIFILLGSLSFATPLWNGATSGMTVDQVLAKFPTAKLPDKPNWVYKIYSLGARIDNFQISENSYDISFWFIGNSLQLVRVKLADGSSSLVKNVFNSLFSSLYGKYGKETRNTFSKNEFVHSEDFYWIINNTLEINLAYRYFPSDGSDDVWIDNKEVADSSLL